MLFLSRGVPIQYQFSFDDGPDQEIEVDIDRAFDPGSDLREYPAWTKLEFNQCGNCPLCREQFRYCPTAVDISEVVTLFKSIISHTGVRVRVVTENREYVKQSDVQTMLRSLLGLIMATSACPILSRLRIQARYHLPFATLEETLYRTVGTYLLQQYFLHKNGLRPDWDLVGLNHFYQDLQVVNTHLKARIDAASEKDANMNAIASLGSMSMAISFSVEDALEDLQRHFLGEDQMINL